MWIVVQNMAALLFYLLACYAFGPNESWAFVAYEELRSHHFLQDISLTERASATIVATKEPDEVWYTFNPPLLPGSSSSSSSSSSSPPPRNKKTYILPPLGDFFLSSWLVDILDPEPEKYSCHRLLGINDRWRVPCHLSPSLFERATKGEEITIVYLVDDPSFNAPLDENGEVIQPSEFYFSTILLVGSFLVDLQLLLGMVLNGVWLWDEIKKRATPPSTKEEEPVFQWARVVSNE